MEEESGSCDLDFDEITKEFLGGADQYEEREAESVEEVSSESNEMALPAAMMMSGLNTESLTSDIQDIFGAIPLLLLKSPSSFDDKAPFSKYLTDSKAIVKNLTPLFELLTKTSSDDDEEEHESLKKMQKSDDIQEEVVKVEDTPVPPPPPPMPPTPPSPPKKVDSCADKSTGRKIMYQGRDLLDLASNISWKWDFQPAELPEGVDNNFHQNRSEDTQIERVAVFREHIFVECECTDCFFKTPFCISPNRPF